MHLLLAIIFHIYTKYYPFGEQESGAAKEATLRLFLPDINYCTSFYPIAGGRAFKSYYSGHF